MCVFVCVCSFISAVRMQVSCAGVNRLDLLQAAGKYPPPPGESDILGVEGSEQAGTELEPSYCHVFLPPSLPPSLLSSFTASPPPFVYPVSGTVAALSPEAAERSGLKLGEPVFALVGGGGYAGMRAAGARGTSTAFTTVLSPQLHPSHSLR